MSKAINEDKTFHIRVREEKIGYYTVKAKTLAEAEREALYKLLCLQQRTTSEILVKFTRVDLLTIV